MAEWVLLAYRLPREPSTPRIAVWRRLRRLGAAQLGDGLAALPLDARTREHFEWLAAEVEEAGGEATVWLADPVTRRQGRELEQRFRASVTAEYRAIEDAARVARTGRAVSRLRAALARVESRDYFDVRARARARRAVDAIGARV